MVVSILLLSPLREGSGNKSTALRIASYFAEPEYRCLVKSPKHFKEATDFKEYLDQNHVDIILAIHAVHCARLLQDCNVLYVLVFGGTDLNCTDQFSDPHNAASHVLTNSRLIVCFSKSMYDQAIINWPDIPKHRLKIVPQGIIDHSFLLPLSGVRVVENQSKDILARCADGLMAHKSCQCDKFCPNAKVFTLVAGIRPVKDPMFLLKAFSEWHLSDSSIYLFIVGPVLDEDLAKNFTETARRLPGVCYIGCMSLPDTHTIVSQSTALLNSSLSEGMSIAILEAMALGTPVIARDIPGNRSVIEHGLTGFLYSTPQECVQRCKEILLKPEWVKTMVGHAKQVVGEKHSCDAERSAYISIVTKSLSASQ